VSGGYLTGQIWKNRGDGLEVKHLQGSRRPRRRADHRHFDELKDHDDHPGGSRTQDGESILAHQQQRRQPRTPAHDDEQREAGDDIALEYGMMLYRIIV
jgi:hypothetical protein